MQRRSAHSLGRGSPDGGATKAAGGVVRAECRPAPTSTSQPAPRHARCWSAKHTNPHVTSTAHSGAHGSSHSGPHSSGSTSETKGFSAILGVPTTPHVTHVHQSSGCGTRFLAWLKEHGAPEQGLTLKSIEPTPLNVTDAGASAPHHRPIDTVVASRPLKAGDVALSVPENLVISLERVFESEFVAELLTTDKLSELACLTLYLMYEKKLGEDSFWQPYIKELDRQRARGSMAVESPLLWEPAEVQELLKGSPLLPAVTQRLQGIKREYDELDTVWYMSQSLFSKYPFDLPSETFTFERFRQAFSAVQASIVHLQGVAPAKRFALVPLGPPLLCYSSTSKALLSWNEATRSVQLVVDRDYAQGEPVYAWCGPQPNSRLLLNYGLVDESNPYDKLPLVTICGSTDPLYQTKRAILQAVGLSTSQSWDLARNKPLPPNLLPFMRLAAAATPEEVAQVTFNAEARDLPDPAREAAVRDHLVDHLQTRLAAYSRTLAGDIAVMADSHSSPRQKVAARLTKIEKSILNSALDQLGVESARSGEACMLQPLPYLRLT